MCTQLTLRRTLRYCASRDLGDIHLYSHHNALVLDNIWEQLSTAVLLIEGLVEKDHSSNALIDGGIGRKEYLSEGPAIFLCVLYLDPLQSVPHST